MLFESLSASSKMQCHQARNLLSEESAKRRRRDPNQVTPSTFQFVVTLLHNYSQVGEAKTTEKKKKEDALVGIISGLLWVYQLSRYRGPWHVSRTADRKRTALGNPLVNNPEIDQLNLAHKRIVSELGATALHAPTIPIHYIVEHAKSYW